MVFHLPKTLMFWVRRKSTLWHVGSLRTYSWIRMSTMKEKESALPWLRISLVLNQLQNSVTGRVTGRSVAIYQIAIKKVSTFSNFSTVIYLARSFIQLFAHEYQRSIRSTQTHATRWRTVSLIFVDVVIRSSVECVYHCQLAHRYMTYRHCVARVNPNRYINHYDYTSSVNTIRTIAYYYLLTATIATRPHSITQKLDA